MKEKDKKNWSRNSELAGVIIVLLSLEFLFARCISEKLMTSMDNKVAYLVIEHWYNFICGREALGSFHTFYPLKGNIGSLDMMVDLAIPYSLLRMTGIDKYVAFKLSASILHVIGSFSLFYFLHKKLKCSILPSLIGTAFFVFSNSMIVHMGHIYLLALCLLPLCMIFLFGFFENINGKRKKRILNGMAFVAVFALLCYSSVYIAQFLVLFGLLSFILYLFLGIKNEIVRKSEITGFLKENYQEMVFFMVWGIFLMVPFFCIYIPLLKQTAGYSAKDMLGYSPYLSDLLNVGPDNWLYGDLITDLGLHQGEFTIGIPILQLIAAIVSFYSVLRIKYSGEDKTAGRRLLFVKTMAVGVIICICLIVKIDDKLSLWAFIRNFIPGQRSVRAISRLVIFLMLPLGVVIAYTLTNTVCRKSTRLLGLKSGFLILLLSIIVAENFSDHMLRDAWKLDEMQALEKSLDSPPPENCQVFFTMDEENREEKASNMWWIYTAAIKAWTLANNYGLNTINNIGSIFPENSYSLFSIYDPDYYYAVCRWIDKYQLEDVYAYDLSKKTWHLAEDILPIGYTDGGFSRYEFNESEYWQWVVANEASIRVVNREHSERKIEISFETKPAPDNISDTVYIYYDDALVSSFKAGETVRFSLNLKEKQHVNIRLVTKDSLYVGATDPRPMAYMVRNLKIDGAPAR